MSLQPSGRRWEAGSGGGGEIAFLPDSSLLFSFFLSFLPFLSLLSPPLLSSLFFPFLFQKKLFNFLLQKMSAVQKCAFQVFVGRRRYLTKRGHMMIYIKHTYTICTMVLVSVSVKSLGTQRIVETSLTRIPCVYSSKL